MITFEHQFEALPVIEIRCDFCFSIQGNHVCVCVIKYTHTHIYIYNERLQYSIEIAQKNLCINLNLKFSKLLNDI